jgi:hypothetical protein
MRLCFAALTAMVLIANSANAAEVVGMPPELLTAIPSPLVQPRFVSKVLTRPRLTRSASTPVVSSGHVASKRATGLLHISQVERLDAFRPTLTSTDENSLCAASRVRT